MVQEEGSDCSQLARQQIDVAVIVMLAQQHPRELATLSVSLKISLIALPIKRFYSFHFVIFLPFGHSVLVVFVSRGDSPFVIYRRGLTPSSAHSQNETFSRKIYPFPDPELMRL